MTIKLSLLIAWLMCIAALETAAQPSAGGVVYGSKGAFSMSAPSGWVLDPTAGAKNGLPCVLYRKGATWDTADPLMYAKIASTDYEDCEKFVQDALADMTAKRRGFQWKRIESGKTSYGLPYFINEYPANASYARSERVAYVQLPKAVAYVVFTASGAGDFRKYQAALTEAVKTIMALTADSSSAEKKSAEQR